MGRVRLVRVCVCVCVTHEELLLGPIGALYIKSVRKEVRTIITTSISGFQHTVNNLLGTSEVNGLHATLLDGIGDTGSGSNSGLSGEG